MCKKILVGVGVFLLAVFFIGFGFTKKFEVRTEYYHQMDNGVQAIKDENYNAAREDFLNALKKRQGDYTAQHDLNQLNLYQQARTQFDNQNYQLANALFTETIHNNGMRPLTQRAHEYQHEIKVIKAKNAAYNALYAKAEVLNDRGEYFQSNQILEEIIMDPDANHHCYHKIILKAKQLRKINEESMAAS